MQILKAWQNLVMSYNKRLARTKIYDKHFVKHTYITYKKFKYHNISINISLWVLNKIIILLRNWSFTSYRFVFFDSISTPDFHRHPDSTLMATVALLIILTTPLINGKSTLEPEQQSRKCNVVGKITHTRKYRMDLFWFLLHTVYTSMYYVIPFVYIYSLFGLLSRKSKNYKFFLPIVGYLLHTMLVQKLHR